MDPAPALLGRVDGSDEDAQSRRVEKRRSREVDDERTGPVGEERIYLVPEPRSHGEIELSRRFEDREIVDTSTVLDAVCTVTVVG